MRRRRDDAFPENGFEAWGGYMRAKIAKLEEQFTDGAASDENRCSDIFSGISIYVNGYTRPSADELKLLMAQHGGVYHTYKRSSDFIIASNLPDTKVKRLTTARIVKPDWITESIASKCLLDYKDYLLYSRNTRLQPKLNFKAINSINNQSPKCERRTGSQDEHQILNVTKKLNFDSKVQTSEARSPQTKLIKIEMFQDSPDDKTVRPNHQIEPTVAVDPHSDGLSQCNDDIKEDENDFIPNSPENINDYRSSKSTTQNSPKFKSKLANPTAHSNSLLVKAEIKLSPTIMNNHNTTSLGSPSVLNNESDSKSTEITESSVQVPGPVQPVSDTIKNEPASNGSVRTANDPKFLSEFYNNSRLHHISQLGAAFKQHVNELRDASDFKFPMRPSLLPRVWDQKSLYKTSTETESIIEKEFKTRIDGVGEKEDGKFGSMSEIASCSYEARALGIKNGMFMGPALRLCPHLKTLPYDFEGYKEVAYTLYNTVAQYTLDIEAVSCDEMYVDCTDVLQQLGLSVEQFAAALRSEIKDKTGCPCSAGFGSNRLQARLATKRAKPDGQFYLTSDAVTEYIQDVALSDLPGVGRQMQNKLSSLNYTTCGSLLSASLASLQKHFGIKTGQLLHDYCRGLDTKPLSFVQVRKSVSAEVNYGIRFEDHTQCDTFLRQLCGEVQSRLRQFKVKGKAVTLKHMVRSGDAPVETAKFMGHGFCDHVTKTTTLQHATDDLNVIIAEILNIHKKLNVDPKEMRGVGIQISKLENVTKTKMDKNKNTFRNYLLKGKVKMADGDRKSDETIGIKKEFENNKRGDVENFKISSDNDVNFNENMKQGDTETDDKKKNVITLKDGNNEEVKVDMYNNIVKLEKTPIKFAAVNGAIKRSPIKNNIMSDFLKGHTTPAGSSRVKNEPVTPKQQYTPSAKRNLSRAIDQPASPPRKKYLGITKGKRGRPRKSCASTGTAKAAGRNDWDDIDLADFDQEVLAALPEEIQREVLEQHRKEKRRVVTANTKSSKRNISKILPKDTEVKIDKDFLDALPVDIRMEVEREYIKKPRNSKILSDRDLAQPGPSSKPDAIPSKTQPQKHDLKTNVLSMPWEQIREMLRAWLKSEKEPLRCDVDLMSSYMQHLVVNRDIESLTILLNFLYRNVSDKKECEWHGAYLHILSGVQDTMVAVYDKKLLAKSFFACCYHPS